ncbi:MAG: hypothetical protein ACK40G_02310 [Cytophagaceae bacterium]
MRKLTLLFLGLIVVGCFSCKKKNPDPIVNGPSEVVLEGNLESMTLDASKKYLIRNQVFVREGKVLTIPAGTIIKGEKKTKGTLVIDRGGKIIAEGTATNPIIFTSNQEAGERDKGDWGGIVMLGNANVNQNNPKIEGITPEVSYGTFNSTANDDENSGILKYVRIEYAGIALTPNNETNSLTMGGIGRGTTIEYVQVTYGGDDGFEWFGGTVNGKYLVSHGIWDDDFDVDFGYTGKVQYALAIRDPFNADQSGSNGFECDNDGNGTTAQPYTAGIFSNVTIIGPQFDSTLSASSHYSGNYQHAMHLRRRTAVSIFNSVIAGFPNGFRLDGETTEAQYTGGTGAIKNNILVTLGQRAAAKPYVAGSGNTVSSVETYWTANNVTFTSNLPAASMPTKNGKKYGKAYDEAGIDPTVIMGFTYDFRDYPANPNFASYFTGATQTGASFSDAKLAGSFFTPTTHRGAFGGSDWTDGWANFFPQSQAY